MYNVNVGQITCNTILIAGVLVGAISTAMAVPEEGGKVAEKVLSYKLNVGLGYDSNAYLTNADPYDDYFALNGGLPTATPTKVQSGMFVPYSVDTQYVTEFGKNNYLIGKLDFSGRMYASSNLSNADFSKYNVRVGDMYIYNKKGRKDDSLYIGFLIGKKDKTYYDRDTGLKKTTVVSGTDISDKYDYDVTGFEVELKNKTSWLQYSARFERLNRNHSDLLVGSHYDHTYILLGGDVKYKINSKSHVKLDFDYYSEGYSDRKAWEYDPTQPLPADQVKLSQNQTAEYIYNKYDITYKYKLSAKWISYFSYQHKTRTDEYLGYNDYTRQTFKLRVRYKYSKKTKLGLKFSSWSNEYPKGVAFDKVVNPGNPINNAKEYDGIKIKLSVDYELDKSKTFWVDVKYNETNTTDLRYQYARAQVITGIKWKK